MAHALLFPYEMREGDTEGARDHHQMVDFYLPVRPLDLDDAGPVQVGALGELFLRPAAALALVSDLVSDLPAASEHPRRNRMSWHPSNVGDS
jgi:hypothetical protein